MVSKFKAEITFEDQHNHQHPFNEGNGESEKGGPKPSNSLADQNKPMEVVTGDAEGSLKVESEDNIASLKNEKPVKEADSNSVLETASADLVNPVVPISETAKVVIEIAQVENPECQRKNEDKVFPISDENVRASANVVGSSAYGNVGKTLVSSASHSAETGNGEEKTIYTDARQSTENKPLLACGPRLAERTLWMSCCGIFDVLTGSK
ncbi:hypothetical protein D5086_003117 [Populus alba]|uniref:Uncharacterized protein n=1 Tax=Populus alba TaxID=43335 RepID=A0ACC4D3L5_POPAL